MAEPKACREVRSVEAEIVSNIMQNKANLKDLPAAHSEVALTAHKKRCVRQIMDHRAFNDAFYRLSRIPGIWPGLVVGNLHKLISLRCDEELLSYLHFIYDTWLQLAGGNESELEKIDWTTVEAVQLRCPRFSASDEQALRDLILRGDVFRNFGHVERLAAFEKLCSFDFPVPSLSTFFKDFGYLEKCGNCLKHLVSLKKGGPTIRRMLFQGFSPPALTKQPEDTFMDTADSLESQFQLAMRHLWLFAMREFHSIHNDPGFLPRCAGLAAELGFDTDEIRSLKEISSHREIARQAVMLVRASQDQDNDFVGDEPVIEQIAQAFPKNQHRIRKQTYSAFTTNATATKMNVRPWLDSKAYLMDCPNLVVEILDGQPLVKKREVTSLFLLRSIYKAIFYEDVQDAKAMTGLVGGSSEKTAPSQNEDRQPARNHPMKSSQYVTAHETDAAVKLQFTEKRLRQATLKITQAGFPRPERCIEIDPEDKNEPSRIEGIIKELMAEYQVLPFSPAGYPLLPADCYGEIMQSSHDCLFLR